MRLCVLPSLDLEAREGMRLGLGVREDGGDRRWGAVWDVMVVGLGSEPPASEAGQVMLSPILGTRCPKAPPSRRPCL